MASQRRGFYVAMALLMSAIVLAGFWPSYYGPLLRGDASRPWVIHIHGIVFIGWMVLLFAQVGLVATGNTKAHKKVGNIGIAYGGLVVTMGLIVGFASPVFHVKAGDWSRDQAAGFLLVILGDMVLFGTFFAASMIYRRKPEIHKRLIVLATTALLFAAVGRMDFISGPAAGAVWLSPVLIAIAYDGLVLRRVYKTYMVGVLILIVGGSRIFFTESEGWLRIGRALLGIFV
jgi:hypothetical protein